MPLILIGCAAVALVGCIPALCLSILAGDQKNEFDPSIKALAIVVLSPFVMFLILVVRHNLK